MIPEPYFIKRFPATFETNSQIVNSLSTLLKFSLPESYFDDYIQNISNCSKAEIEKSIIDHFRTDELIYLIVGDREVVMPQLKQITNLEIVELDVEGNLV